MKNFASTGGPKVALFPLGNMQKMARNTAEQLTAAGCDVAIINPRFTKPLDNATHEFFGKAADVVITFEDHALMGGYGSIVNELFSDQRITTPVIRIGWPDVFIEHASSVDYLRQRHGLSADNAVAKAKVELAKLTGTEPKRQFAVL